MKFRNRLIALFGVAVLGVLGAGTPMAMAAPGPRPSKPNSEAAEELRETFQLVMLSRLKRELQMSPEQEATVLPLLDEMEQSRQEMRYHRHRDMYDLRRLLHADADDDQIEARLREARAARRTFENRRQQIEEEVAAHLSPHQQAQLLVFMQEFSRRLRHQLGEIRRQGSPPGGRGRRRSPPQDEDFWDEDLP
ncbi:MAG: hypothetical protein O7F16_10800 [Acidobacteria bacterium]|nr:hypothetical protein [Acidobacteriota bacterium]